MWPSSVATARMFCSQCLRSQLSILTLQQGALSATTIQLRVKDFGNFVFGFAINFDWGRRQLDAIWDDIGGRELKLRDVEDRVDCAHRVGKMDGKG